MRWLASASSSCASRVIPHCAVVSAWCSPIDSPVRGSALLRHRRDEVLGPQPGERREPAAAPILARFSPQQHACAGPR